MASVFLADLDADAIGLSQGCTNPLFVVNPNAKEATTKAAEAEATSGAATQKKHRVTLALDDDDGDAARDNDDKASEVLFFEPRKNNTQEESTLSSSHGGRSGKTTTEGVMRTGKQNKATVSLSDCLACSGCVTTAETVLLSRDATAALREVCALANADSSSSSDAAEVVVAFSHASLASLADSADASTAKALAAARDALRQPPWSIKHVTTDSAVVRDLTLRESFEEFWHRLPKNARAATAPNPSVALSRDAERDALTGRDVHLGPPSRNDAGPLPVLVSECPGVVCFLEKSAPHAVPYLSSVRSRSAATAALVKNHRRRNTNIQLAGEDREEGTSVIGRRCVVVAVAPCADKKLEAARRDLASDDDRRGQDVELALTTAEFVAAIGGVDKWRECVRAAEPSARDVKDATPPARKGAQSGGYLEHAYRATAAKLGLAVPTDLPYERRGNDDFHVAALDVTQASEGKIVPGGRTTILFARAYGFRNVQKIANVLKRSGCRYDFVEIMACPSGCVNGGGQLRPDDERSRDDAKRRVARVSAVFHAAVEDVVSSSSDEAPLEEDFVLDEDDEADLDEDALAPHLHTRFHHIPALEHTLDPGQAKW